MPTATFVKFENFVEDVLSGVHNFLAAGHTTRVYLSDAAPNVATHEVKANIAEITIENGYTGPVDTQNDMTRTGGTATVTGVSFTLTSTGAGFGPFQYVVHYNDTPTSPADPLINYWDYGSAITPNGGETFEVRMNAVASGSPGTILTAT